MTENLSKMQLQLARELVDDVELSHLPVEQILLKALRLARLLEDEKTQEWLRYELNGYPNTPQSRPWMRRFGRFTNEETNMGYWSPLAGITGTIVAMQTQIQTLRVPDIHFAQSSANPHEFIGSSANFTAQTMVKPAQTVLVRLENLTTAVSTLSSIRSRVLAGVHDFTVTSYHRLAFSGLVESIFEKHRKAVDELMRSIAPETIAKVPAVYDRLTAGDPEAISHGMSTLRRIIKSLADRVYPACDQPVQIDGQRYEVGADKVLNRIKLFLLTNCPSESRRDRLNRSIHDIHERASAGTHSDIDATEARSLFLSMYLVIGEVLGFVEMQKGEGDAHQEDILNEQAVIGELPTRS
ncbi:MAG: hypothetical protein ABII93_05340 [Chrysiogenia bacterium]